MSQANSQHLLETAVQFHRSGQFAEAESIYRQILLREPSNAVALHFLGALAHAMGKTDVAIALIHRALRLNPGLAEAHHNLGFALQSQGKLDAAVAAYREAIRLRPEVGEFHFNLASALLELGRIDDAVGSSRRAIELNPDSAKAHEGLGAALRERGDLDEAVACYRRAIALDPGNASLHSNFIYALHFHPDFDMRAIAQEQREWRRRHSDPLKSSIQPHLNDRNPDRRLRIGYVSPDFGLHAECFFVLPLLEAHDRSRFEIHCYASVRRPDFISERTKKAADLWHEALGLSDAALADRIRADRIDILVDLTMNLTDNRLLLFARKPAPVQVTWLAYPGSTGLDAIDYRLTDAFLDPPGEDTSWSSEQPVRLPDFWCCYDPIFKATEVAYPPPRDRNGFVTFGSLNTFRKINRPVLQLWAGLLRAVEGSRVHLLCPTGREHRQRALDILEAEGIAPARVEFIDPRPHRAYLETYQQIDIALDPFPYSGITTTCDALWMGVPVITLPGQSPASRGAAGLLKTVGLPELVARSREDFIAIGVDLARNSARLSGIRSSLRQRMMDSPLMDAPRFARNVEAEYRHMWRKWCAQ